MDCRWMNLVTLLAAMIPPEVVAHQSLPRYSSRLTKNHLNSNWIVVVVAVVVALAVLLLARG